jgi:hypothetical protein
MVGVEESMIKLVNGAECLSVGELKKALEGVDENLPVEVFFSADVPSGNPDGAYIDKALESKGSPFSWPCFDLYVTRFFWY